MKISNVSFKGYGERGTKRLGLVEDAKQEIEKARPYLKLIGNSLPCNNDLFLKVNSMGDFTVSITDKKNETETDILNCCEHDFIGNGLWLVGDTFKGLAKYSKEIFEETAKDFCLHFSNLERDMDPQHKEFIRGVAEVAASLHDHCC